MIFRFNFHDDVTQELYSFSKINQYLERADYKEKWEEWIEEKSAMIQEETRRLESLGYKGNVIEKMFKSARYYFRSKTAPNEPKQRRKYVTIDKDFLRKIDNFIEEEMQKPDFTPKKSFETFCEGGDFEQYKKVFKNRYFVLAKKQKNNCEV